MTARRAFFVGNLVSAGVEALLVGVFGTKIHHWYLAGGLRIMSRRGLGRSAIHSQLGAGQLAANLGTIFAFPNLPGMS
jgi:hypothetical protein